MSGSVRRISRARVGRVFSASVAGVPVDQAKRAPPLSLRLSAGERAELERLAGERSLNGYIRGRLFAGSETLQAPRTRQTTIHDDASLAQVLRALGNAECIRDIGNLRVAYDEGNVFLGEEAELAVRQACADIAVMRRDLVVALGLKAGGVRP